MGKIGAAYVSSLSDFKKTNFKTRKNKLKDIFMDELSPFSFPKRKEKFYYSIVMSWNTSAMLEVKPKYLMSLIIFYSLDPKTKANLDKL